MGHWDEITAQTLSDWAAAGQHGDAEAAFRLAAYAYEHHHSEAADGWMRLAARFGGAEMLWRLADLVKGDSSGAAAARWQRQAIAAEWGGTTVTVDEDTFRIFSMMPDSYRTQDFSLYVRGEPEDGVLSALIAAGRRFGCVGDDGTEYADGDEALDCADYNPHYVSNPEEHPGGGWQFWMDCQGEVYPLMAATQLRILVEELRSDGITAARIGPRS